MSNELKPCPECDNTYLAIRTDVYKDGREFVYCDCCGCLAQKSLWNLIERRATPSPSTAPTQQDQANVLPPFAAPAGQHDTSAGETLDQKAENALLWCYRRLKNSYGRLPFVEEAVAGLRERTAAAGAAREGGVTNSNSAEFDGIKQSSTAPTVEVDERAAATILKSIIEDGYLSETNVARYHAALASKPPAREVAERQSIESDPRFVELLDEFAYRASERRAMGGDFGSAEAEEVAEAALIAHIDTWGGATREEK